MTLDAHGFHVFPDAINPALIADITTEIEHHLAAHPPQRRRDRAGLRDLFETCPATRNLLAEPGIIQPVTDALGPNAAAVRVLYFDKQPDTNWHVGWHQDLTIAVDQQADAPGFGPFSTKAGVTHCKAPASLLENMLAVRVHLDDCGPDNGPLQCLPGSHGLGVLDPADIMPVVHAGTPQTCTVNQAGLVLMRPLCLHASSPATAPRHRRVIHLEFAADPLPTPLEWHQRHCMPHPV
ncbi:MAG: phytanoyl-CoA dioxygenase family protein [Planctomycetota bacterium]